MTHERHDHLESRYHRALNAAYEWAFDRATPKRADRYSLAQLRRELSQRLLQDLPSPGLRKFHVSPETIAPFVSLLQQIDATLGFYILVDIGACTSEVLVVYLKQPDDSGRRFVSYWDATAFVGGNDFQADIEDGAEPPTRRLERHIRQTLYQAFRKDKKNRHQRQRWRQLILLESGGGILDLHAQTVLGDRQWLRQAMQSFECDVHTTRHTPIADDLRVPQGVAHNNGSREHFYMLANGHGLSVPWPRWDGWFPPDEVEELGDDTPPLNPITSWDDG